MRTQKTMSAFTHMRQAVQASVEAQLGQGMSPEGLKLVDTICKAATEDGADLTELHETLSMLHGAFKGDADSDQIAAALSAAREDMDLGEEPVAALRSHIGPLAPTCN